MREIKKLPETAPLSRLVAAHRANINFGLPDNSLPAIHEAIRFGVAHLEVDVRQSTAGELFLFHDGSLSGSNYHSPRALCGRAVQELSRDELRSVRLDSAGAIQIPLFSEALAAISSHNVTLQVDLKGESDQLAEAVIQEILRKGAIDRCVVQFRNLDRMQTMLERYPTLRTLARCKNDECVTHALNVGAELIELEGWASAQAIESSHSERVRVLVNIAHPFYDDPTVWALLRSRGIDIIMTDHAACIEKTPDHTPAQCLSL
jgi:glycerophosphoryl diester phosphodiesterase